MEVGTEMESLKIAFFCWESLHSVRIGGLAAAATNLAESLAKRHEVHYFTLGPEKEEEINGVFYHRCNPSGSNIVEYCRNMSLSMADDYLNEEKKGEFDVLHFHDWHPTEALHILQDRPTVLTLHSTEYGRNGNSFGEWWEFKEISGKEWYASLKAKKVTTVSHTLKNEVMWLYNVPDWKVVGSDVGGLSENIDNFENGVKVYPTSDSIKWGVDYVMDSNSDSKKMGKRGREKVGRKFRWQNVADQMVEAYECL